MTVTPSTYMTAMTMQRSPMKSTEQTLEQFVREHDDRLHGHLGDLGYDTIEILEDYQKRDFQPISRRRYVLKNWLRDLIPKMKTTCNLHDLDGESLSHWIDLHGVSHTETGRQGQLIHYRSVNISPVFRAPCTQVFKRWVLRAFDRRGATVIVSGAGTWTIVGSNTACVIKLQSESRCRVSWAD